MARTGYDYLPPVITADAGAAAMPASSGVYEVPVSRRALAAGGIVLTGALALAGCGSDMPFVGSHNSPSTHTKAASTDNCEDDNAVFADVSLNPTYFDTTNDGVLPMATFNIDNNKNAQKYVDNLFTKGPLGEKMDKGSLAIFASVVTDRATNKANAIDTHYSLEDHFASHIRDFNFGGDDGLNAAKALCEKSYQVASQVANKNDHWAGVGEMVYQVLLIHNSDGTPGVKLDARPAKNVLSGIEFTYNDTAKGVYQGFPSVLIDDNGAMFLKYEAPTAAKPTPTPSPTPSSGESKSHNTQGQAENNNANNGGSAGGGNQRGVAKGHTPEHHPNGPNHQKGIGGPGKKHEATPGKHKSPNGGNNRPTPAPSPRQTGTTPPGNGPGGPGPGPGPGGETTPPTHNQTTPPATHSTPPSTPPSTHSTPPSTPPSTESAPKAGTTEDPNIAMPSPTSTPSN